MSFSEDQAEQISPVQHQMLMDSLSPDEQHRLKLVRETATVDQEKSIKLCLMGCRALFDEVATNPILRTAGVMDRLKTEAHARIVQNILRNPVFSMDVDVLETQKMEQWAKKA